MSAPPPSNGSAETRNGSPDPTARLAALAGTAPLLADDRVETTLDPELTQRVHKALEIGRVSLGHVILMEPGTGRVLAWASTDPERFPPTRTYPAASLIKVVTAAAALDRNPELLRRPCRYQGSPWRLNRQRIDPPLRGVESSFQKALAISNNQCFAQIAVNDLGADVLLGAIERFGWLEPPAPGYEAGSADAGDDRFDLGKLGCGLAGCRITPLHAVQMAGILADGWLREPRWIESMTDARGRLLALPPPRPARQVLTPELAKRMREMLVDTTARGTARSAFRDRRGRPILGSIQVAGKTGSLSGRDPDGRYEWFMGVAPADEPEVALAVVVVQGPRWWRSASQIAAEVLKQRFCPKTTCR